MTPLATPATPHWRQYLLTFALVATATVALVAFFLWTAYRQSESAAAVALENIAQTVETSVDASLRRVHSALENIATELPDDALDQKNRERHAARVLLNLNTQTSHFPELHSYRIYDANGDDLYISGQVAPRHNVAERGYFKCAKENLHLPLCYSEAFVGKVSRRAVVVVAKPLTDAAGRFRGIIVGGLGMAYFVKMFATLELGHNGVIALRRTEDGALVARWPESPEALNVPYKPEHPLWPWLKDGRKDGLQSLTSQTDGISRLFAMRRLDDYPFFVVLGQPAPTYLAAWRQTAFIAGAFTLAVLVALAALLQRSYRLRQAELQHMAELATARDLAESANRAKSAFLANMSHELRTPMNAIIGLTALLLRRAEEPKLRDQLGKIDQAAQHLLSIINDILDISKIEAERMTLDRTSFRPGEILENLVSLVEYKVREKQLELRINLPPAIATLALVGDPLRLGQILLNFTSNAIKFTEQGSITVGGEVLEETPQTVLLRFDIVDTGIGIAHADQKRLFAAFEQADGSMTRKYGGTGLGLVISRRLARLMGGDAGVESTVGQGSRFWFMVRLEKATTTENTVSPASTFGPSAENRIKSLHAGKRVLLVEDEPINREVAHDLLESVGLNVAVAMDGAEALAMARHTVYALILMDMQMPRMNGLDATQAIRADSPNAATPVLAMTANIFEQDRQACFAAGMNDHIAKPIDPDQLFVTLAKWLAKSAGSA